MSVQAAEVRPPCSLRSELWHRNGLNQYLLSEVTQRQADRWRQAAEQTWLRWPFSGPKVHVFPLQSVLFGLERFFPTIQLTFDSNARIHRSGSANEPLQECPTIGLG